MLNNLQALPLRGFGVSQRFALLIFFCVLAITVLVCAACSAVLRRQLVAHDGAVIGDLASRLFTSSVPAEFFAVPSGTPPAGAERLREFARSEQVVRFMVYDADGWVLWSDRSEEHTSELQSRRYLLFFPTRRSSDLRRQLVAHEGAVIGDLASRLFTSSVPAEFFAVPSGTPPAGAERLREFARSEQVVRFMVYDADGWVLWSD